MARAVVVALMLVTAMSGGAPRAADETSHAMGLWTPHPEHDTCSAAYHDSFSAMGSDGKRYPTWHPPEGEEQGRPCTFGHEHGRDPRGSALLADVEAQYGGVLFGYANEQLDEYNRAERIGDRMRHEDHVGHKIEWENDVEVFESVTNGGADPARAGHPLRLPDEGPPGHAQPRRLHQQPARAALRRAVPRPRRRQRRHQAHRLHDGAVRRSRRVLGGRRRRRLRLREGRHRRRRRQSPAGTGLRSIPTIGRVQSAVLVPPGERSDYSRGLYEDWLSANYLRRPGGREPLAYFDPHFAVFLPARFYWPTRQAESVQAPRAAPATSPRRIGRTVDLCYASDRRRVARRGGECDRLPEGAARRLGRSALAVRRREARVLFQPDDDRECRQSDHLVHRSVRRPRQRAALPRRDQASSSPPSTTASATTPA